MEISIDKEKERFHQFISEEGNNNIIFSGVFGIGKSYFLNKFFNEYYNYFIYCFVPIVTYSSNDQFALLHYGNNTPLYYRTYLYIH